MQLKLDKTMDKWTALRRIKDELVMAYGFLMDDVDEQKPWGAYYRFVMEDKDKFLNLYFPDYEKSEFDKINPKYLVFEPGKKTSLQYHNRRAEIWKVIYGTIEAYNGPEDNPGPYETYEVGDTISYGATMRHKGGAASDGWAVVAEIWQHVDDNNPSDEDDNIRLADDFGRA